jgi:hypothetical protein
VDQGSLISLILLLNLAIESKELVRGSLINWLSIRKGNGQGTGSGFPDFPDIRIILGNSKEPVQGSLISLICILENSLLPPDYVFWYQNDKMINFDSSRGVTVQTTTGRKTSSKLNIKRYVTCIFSCKKFLGYTPYHVPQYMVLYESTVLYRLCMTID